MFRKLFEEVFTRMSLRIEKNEENSKPRTYVIVADDATLNRSFQCSRLNESDVFDPESSRQEYDCQLQQMQLFYERVREWICTHGLSEEVLSLEEPQVPVGSLIAFCTPASANSIAEMNGVKAVIQEL